MTPAAPARLAGTLADGLRATRAVRTLLLTALAALAGAASALALSPGPAPGPASSSHRRGRAPPPLAPAVAGAASSTPTGAPHALAEVPARAPETLPGELAEREGPDLDIRVVDGESGARLDVPVQTRITPTDRGAYELVARIDPPAGWMPAETSSTELRAHIPAAARSATFVLVPAVRVVLRPDGRLRGRVRAATLLLGDRAMAPRGRSPLVFDVPRHAGARLTATVTTAGGDAGAATVIPTGATSIVLDVPGDDPVADPRDGSVCRGAPSAPSLAAGGADHDLTPISDAGGVCVLRGMPPQGLELAVRWGGVSAPAEERAPGVFSARLPLPASD